MRKLGMIERHNTPNDQCLTCEKMDVMRGGLLVGFVGFGADPVS
jgi:hypothetical protein